MKNSFWTFLGRVAIIVALYPWLVSYDSPVDSLSHAISIYGSEGSYTHVTRDCNGNLTSILPVPFAEVAASYEAPIQNGFGYKLRGGYLHSLYGYNLVDPNSQAVAASQDIVYGGGSLGMNSPFFGGDFGLLAFNRNTTLANLRTYAPVNPSGSDGLAGEFSVTGEFRLGYLDAWYYTMSLLNSDPIIGSRPFFNTGIGVALSKSDEHARIRTAPSNLWLGIGFGTPFEYTGTDAFLTPSYDPVLCGEITVPAWTYWRIGLRGGVDPSGHGGGYASGMLSYGW